MPFESGGRADKAGNHYENHWVIYQILRILEDEIATIKVEPLGEEEIVTDVIVTDNNNVKDYQQCKARNASKDSWSIYDLKSHNLLNGWKKHLDNDPSNLVSLVSSLSCNNLKDLSKRANNNNGDPVKFYEIQVKKSNKTFVTFYEKFCYEMQLDISKKEDILKSICYLRRIQYRQFSEDILESLIRRIINHLFCSDYYKVYNALLSFVINMKWDKEITSGCLRKYLKDQNIFFRHLENDSSILSLLNSLNENFKSLFSPLNGEWIERKEVQECMKYISDGKSVIVHGKAGYGKSGCLKKLIQYINQETIPYIAISLDVNMPCTSLNKWSKELGLPDSLVYCMNYIAKDRPSVIILDQLDALQWTKTNISAAISVCKSLINEVEVCNFYRKDNQKISIVLSCRTYDLENDLNIKKIFSHNYDSALNSKKIQWEKIKMDKLTDIVVETFIGKETYNSLSLKLKSLLRIPANLEIYLQLGNEFHNNINTSKDLIKNWIDIIIKEAPNQQVLENDIYNMINFMIDNMTQNGELYISSLLINVKLGVRDYLASVGLLNVYDNKIAFRHQSYFDYFLAVKLFNKYYEQRNVENILGAEKTQTLEYRYQIQMFMQMLLDYSKKLFISFGEDLSSMNDVRYYIKSLFYELLGDIDEIDENIEEFALERFEDEFFVNITVYGNKSYINLYLNNGILNKWINDSNKRTDALFLLMSIAPEYSPEMITFIEKNIVNNTNYSIDEIAKFFILNDIEQDTDEFFELRMKFYENHPDYSRSVHLNFGKLLPEYECRVARLLTFLIEHFQDDNSKIPNLFIKQDELHICDYQSVLDIILPIVLKDDTFAKEWHSMYRHNNIWNFCMKFIKGAYHEMINKEPELYWNKCLELEKLNNSVVNMIILDSFSYLPEKYSSKIFSYLSEDIESRGINPFNKDDLLGLLKNVIEKHILYCNYTSFKLFEKAIVSFIPKNMKRLYKYRVEYNKENKYMSNFLSFWGGFQHEILPCLPFERLSQKSKDLIKVLDRRFENIFTRYHKQNTSSMAGYVFSSVRGKDISDKSWLSIITNKKLLSKRANWKYIKGTIIENSLYYLAEDIVPVVSNNPGKWLSMSLENRENILEPFWKYILLGISNADEISNIEDDLLIQFLRNVKYDLHSQEAGYICEIIEKRADINWSPDILEKLKDISLHHCDPENEDIISSDQIFSKMLNSVRGKAAKAIGALLWKQSSLYHQFKDVIDSISHDDNIIIKFASLWVLRPICNIDREYASKSILDLYNNYPKLMIFPGTIQLLHFIYQKYSNEVTCLMENVFNINEESIIEVPGHCIVNMYFNFRNDNFFHIISNLEKLNNNQQKVIIEMLIACYKVDEYRVEVQNIILKFYSSNIEENDWLTSLFFKDCIDLNRDKEFLLKLMRCKNLSKETINRFLWLLEDFSNFVIDYSDVIFSICETILKKQELDESTDRLDYLLNERIIRFIFMLYDSTINSSNPSKKQIFLKSMDIFDRIFKSQRMSRKYLIRRINEKIDSNVS